MGCLVQRYYDDLIKLLPEVDLFIKIDEYNQLWDKVEDLVKRNIVNKSETKAITKITEIPQMPMFEQGEFLDRVVTTGKKFCLFKNWRRM